MAVPAGSMRATGLPHPTISPHTLQQHSHIQQPHYLGGWVENTLSLLAEVSQPLLNWLFLHGHAHL